MCVGGSGRPGCCFEDVSRSSKVSWLCKTKLPGAKSPFCSVLAKILLCISQDILDKLLTFSVSQFLICEMWMIIVSLFEKSFLTFSYSTAKIMKIMLACPLGC